MSRLTTLKISLFSAFATLLLLLAMLASTGTASAHTTGCRPPFCHRTSPTLSARLGPPNSLFTACSSLTVQGTGFAPGTVTLVDEEVVPRVSLLSNQVTANAFGNFHSSTLICPVGPGEHYGIFVAIDSHGNKSNEVVVILPN